MKINYFKIFVISIFSVIVVTSCKKSEDNVSLESNAWIESKDRADTIIFTESALILNRTRELQNGYLLPKAGAGPYFFKKLNDSIGLQYSLSSYWQIKNYPFKVDGNKLYIGDFYKGSGQVLVFEKLK